jgi:ferredoxin
MFLESIQILANSMREAMKITIDRDGCIECGVCEATCGDVFELKNNEKASVKSNLRRNGNPAEGEVRDDLASCAKEAADGCPVTVIKVE